MFGVSFPEFIVLGTVALLVLGPDKLPGMLRTMGQWVAKVRRLTTEVRYQSGIDEVLRAEGFDGGLNELRSMMRGGAPSHSPAPVRPPQPEVFVPDRTREYPSEGADAYGALPEDLVAPAVAEAPAIAEAPAVPEPPLAPRPAVPVLGAEPTAGSPAAETAAGSPSAPSTDSPAPREPNG